MKGSPLFLLLCCLCLLPARLFSLGGKETSPPAPPEGDLYEHAAEGQVLTLTGRVRLVGNEPFPELVLTDGAGNDWYIGEEGRALLAPYQHQLVTIRGTVRLLELVLANGRTLGTRRIILRPELRSPPGGNR